MTIDALTHIGETPHAFGSRYDASLEFLLGRMDAGGVAKSVVTAIAADTHYGVSNEFVAESCAKHPDRLIPVASVNPIRDTNPVELLVQAISELGMRGLKLHPRHQQLAIDDTRLVPVVEKAAELGIPTYICTSQWKFRPLSDQLPLGVDVLAKRVPEARIIMTHAGGFQFMDALMVAVSNPNVYLETSMSSKFFEGSPFEEQWVWVLKKVGAQRVIFGSDHPEEPTDDSYERTRTMLQRHGFSGEELSQIFGGTIAGLLGLSDT